MDKYKFVLNHKIQLLENEIEPKDNKIGEMKQQILAMEEELTAVVKDQAKPLQCIILCYLSISYSHRLACQFLKQFLAVLTSINIIFCSDSSLIRRSSTCR